MFHGLGGTWCLDHIAAAEVAFAVSGYAYKLFEMCHLEWFVVTLDKGVTTDVGMEPLTG